MRPILRSIVIALLLPLTLVACDDDDDEPTDVDPGPYTLTFEGDETFQGPHGDQEIRVALVRQGDDGIVAEDRGTVAADGENGFSFTFADAMQADVAYDVVYWIDSNFNGGAAGRCEGIDVDHQWRVAVGTPTEDVTLTEDHDPSTRSDVCDFFTASLTFEGDASFQGAHGDQEITVALLNESDETIGLASGTVAAGSDPTFSFTFDALDRGASYGVRYWIDSNFGGGSLGVCDPPENDHQWDVDVGMVDDDVTHTEDHRPGDVTAVCETFTADLTFAGDASFQGAHGGQDVTVGVVDGDGRLVATAEQTVSGTADPSFSFDLPGQLVVGREYRVDYWIDSNFQGGAEDVCDPVDDDHQWRVDLGTVAGDVSRTEPHEPGNQTSVCDTFD